MKERWSKLTTITFGPSQIRQNDPKDKELGKRIGTHTRARTQRDAQLDDCLLAKALKMLELDMFYSYLR